jgi:hypothetical protein
LVVIAVIVRIIWFGHLHIQCVNKSGG